MGKINYCPKCGKELTDGSNFCPSCGSHLNGGGSQGTPTPKKGGSSNFFLWGLLIVFVLGAFWLFSDDETDEFGGVEDTEVNVTVDEDAINDLVTPSGDAEESSQSSSVEVENTPKVQHSKAKPKRKLDEHYKAAMEAYNAGEGLDAIRLFKLSGTAKAYYMIGIIHEEGCGSVGANPMMARKYFQKSAEMGYEDAEAKL